MNVENAPFLVTKLNVKVLPCVVVFVDGVSSDRIVGFEGLGYTADTFTTKDLEARLLQSGVIQRANTSGSGTVQYVSQQAPKEKNYDYDDDDDWD